MNRYKWNLFTWRQRIYLRDGTLYMTRWKLDFYWFSIRLHRFTASDDQRALHDHPWPFWTLILKGGYYDVTWDKDWQCVLQWLRPFTLHYRPMGHKHTVKLKPDKPVWTLVFTGKYQHRWGFYVLNSQGKERFVNSKRYFLEFGHH